MSRRHIKFTEVGKMLPEQIDHLPQPAEFRTQKQSRRMRWVGFGWVNEGPADGTEPLLVTEEGP
jgi:hypothetical protein